MTHTYFIGTVGSIKTQQGYGFITIGSVSKEDGSEHGLATEHDIFIHQEECTATLRVGLEVKFRAVPDTKRGVGYFRALTAQEIPMTELLPDKGAAISGLAVVATTQGNIALIKERSPHYGMKDIPAEAVAKAAANEPLKDVPREEPASVELNGSTSQLADILGAYLFTQFPGLQNLGLNHQVVEFIVPAEDALVADAVQGYREMGMEDQASLTEEEYKRYMATRELLAWIHQQGWFLPGARVSPAVIGSLVATIRDIPDSAAKAETIGKLKQVFGFMGDHGLIRTSTVLPLRFLPDLFVAAPIWFFDLQGAALEKANESISKKVRDPNVQQATKDICALFPDNPRWHDTFQMFNRRCRPIQAFKGDIIPPAIIRLIREARDVFDRVVIMTPYLDIAGADWMDLAWIRSIDPYVVGFKKGCPAFFVLARFSNTGVFPLLNELTADTMRFLQENSQKLLSFNAANRPFWYQRCADCWEGRDNARLGTHLVAMVAEMLRAYEANHLFDWLRNEWTEEAFLNRSGQQIAVTAPGQRLQS